MQQQKIDLAQAQPQKQSRAVAPAPAAEMRRQDLVVMNNSLRRGGAMPSLSRAVIEIGGADVAIDKPQRLLDGPGASAAAQFPGAEPDQRDFGAVGLDAGAWSNR